MAISTCAIVLQHRVDRVDQIAMGVERIFRLADVRALAGQPEDDQFRAQRVGDVDRPLRAVDGPAAALRIVRREAAVDAVGMFPKPGRDELGHQPFAVEHLLDLRGLLDDLGRRQVFQVRHGVVVVELDAVEAELLVHLQFLGKRHRRPHGRARRDPLPHGCSRDQTKSDNRSLASFSQA